MTLVCAICDESSVHKAGCTANWYDYPQRSLNTLSANDHNKLAKKAVKRFKIWKETTILNTDHRYKGLDKYQSSACALCGQGIEFHD